MKRINKTRRSIIIAACLLTVFVSCSSKNEFVQLISTDQTKPDPIKEYKVINFNGGAYIVYSLPKVDNILYVQANYDLDGGSERPVQTRASYFTDTITVEGFAMEKEYDIKLTVVSRANIASDPTTVKVRPDKPVFKRVAENLVMEPDFQGVRVRAENENKKDVGIVFLDQFNGSLSIRQQNFSNFENISFAIRGYDTIPKVFAAYVTDKWGNRSDTVFATVAPLYETKLDKTKFSLYALASETPNHNSGLFPTRYLWDNNISTNWITTNTVPGITLPVYATFKLGTYAKLSRFKFIPRQGLADLEYKHGHPRHFTLWGSDKDNPSDFIPPLQSEEGTQIGDWVNVGNFVYPDPPSGAAPNAATAADKAFFNAGVEFPISFNAPKVKCLRFAVNETWVPGTFTQAGELDLFGDDR